MFYKSYVENSMSQFPRGAEAYRDKLVRLVPEGSNCLHLGCGHDIEGMHGLLEKASLIVGVDPDRSAIRSYAGESFCARGEVLPFGDNSFDVVFSEYVLEHLENPALVFSEVSRVLSGGGKFISLAPNRFSYKSLIAGATPLAFHRFAVRSLRTDSIREDHDVYQTYYRANSLASISSLATRSTLTLESIDYVNNGPTWFQRIPLLFEIGMLYHFLLRLELFRKFRCAIVVVLSKPGEVCSSDMTVKCIDCGRYPMDRNCETYLCERCGKGYSKIDGYWECDA